MQMVTIEEERQITNVKKNSIGQFFEVHCPLRSFFNWAIRKKQTKEQQQQQQKLAKISLVDSSL